jgi:hypothetical protein
MAGLAAPALAGARVLKGDGDRFSVESDRVDVRDFEKYHQGIGTIGARFFQFDGAPVPANFLIYDIPPGCSEGVHVHNTVDPALGPFDEYYYIIAGTGVMPIDGERVPVSAGDHVHTPMGVHHGIENNGNAMLRVFLTYINRAPYAGRP